MALIISDFSGVNINRSLSLENAEGPEFEEFPFFFYLSAHSANSAV